MKGELIIANLELGTVPADTWSGTKGKRWRAILHNRSLMIGGTIVFLLVFVGVFAPVLAPYSPYKAFHHGLSLQGAPRPPGPRFLLGTDPLGRDVLSRLIYGARTSLEIGVLATVVTMIIGTGIGISSAYFGGWVDFSLMRFTDVMLSFPLILFAIYMVAVLKPSVFVIYVVLGVLGWAGIARIVRAQALSIRHLVYVEAAYAQGASHVRILFRYILPNILPQVITLGTLRIGVYITLEAALSYLGIGVPEPIPSWGSMITSGQEYFQIAPWLLLYPGITLSLAVIGFNLLGDGLNDLFNPRLQERKG